MAKLNQKLPFMEKTHEGAPAARLSPEKMLRRSLMSCLLWEDSFYEDGESIADRLSTLTHSIDPHVASHLAIEARTKQMLRHAPLWIARALSNHPKRSQDPPLVSKTMDEVIRRPDEMCEFLKMYWKDGKTPLSAQVKKGLARAFTKFTEYQLSKWNRDGEIKLKDVLFLSHAKPMNKEQEDLWKKLIDNKLDTPDTWEVALSGGADKKEAFSRLLSEGTLPSFAFISNLRNMQQSGMEKSFVRKYLESYSFNKVLPYRFIAAAMAVPGWEDVIEIPMLKKLESSEKMSGKTVLLVDVSGSMSDTLSGKSMMSRIDAANALAILLREICEDIAIYSFSNSSVEIPPRRGFALSDAIKKSQAHSGTYLNRALELLARQTNEADRLIIITDEQSADRPVFPNCTTYLMNVATYRNGIGYGKTIVNIDGWSENSVKFISEYERDRPD